MKNLFAMFLNKPIKYKSLIEFIGLIFYILGSVLSMLAWVAISMFIIYFIKVEHFVVSIIGFIIGFGITLLLFTPFLWVFSKFEFDRNQFYVYLYVKLNLKTKISYKETVHIETLFLGNLYGTDWHPMLEVLRIEKNKRLKYLKDYIVKLEQNREESFLNGLSNFQEI